MIISEERRREAVTKLEELMKCIEKMSDEEVRYHERLDDLYSKAQEIYFEIEKLLCSED